MLTGDRGKYYTLICGIIFTCLLIAEHCVTFCGVMMRTTGLIRDVHVFGSSLDVLDPFGSDAGSIGHVADAASVGDPQRRVMISSPRAHSVSAIKQSPPNVQPQKFDVAPNVAHRLRAR